MAPFEQSLDPARGYFVIVEPASRAKPSVQALVQWLLEQAQSQA